MKSLVSSHKGLAGLVLAVAVVGTLGAFVGQYCPLLPASSFGSTGQWVAGAAALALIQAMRIESASRLQQAIHLAAADAEAHVAVLRTSQGTMREEGRASIARSLQVVATTANSETLFKAAELVRIVRPSEILPEGYIAAGEPLLDVIRSDLIEALRSVSLQGTIPDQLEARLVKLPDQVRHYHERCDLAAEFGQQFTRAFHGRSALEAMDLMTNLVQNYGEDHPDERDQLLAAIDQLRDQYRETGAVNSNLRNDLVHPKFRALQQQIQNQPPT